MPIETANFISDLVDTNPDGSDQLSTTDNHLRLIKQALKQSFTGISGECSATHAELNRVKHFANVDREVSASAGPLNTLALISPLGGSLIQSSSAGAALTLLGKKPVSGHMILGADQEIPIGVFKRIAWAKTSFLSGDANYDTANSVFQVRTAGLYLCSWNIASVMLSAGGTFETRLDIPTATGATSLQNSPVFSRFIVPFNVGVHHNNCGVVALSAGHMISVVIIVTGVNSFTLFGGNANFTVVRLGDAP